MMMHEPSPSLTPSPQLADSGSRHCPNVALPDRRQTTIHHRRGGPRRALSLALLMMQLLILSPFVFGQGFRPELEAIAERVRRREVVELITTLGSEVNQEIAQSSLITGLSATGWQYVDFEKSANLGATFTEPAWTLGPDLPISLAVNYVFLDYELFDGEDIEDFLVELIEEDRVTLEDSPLAGYTTELVIDGYGGIENVQAHILAFTGTVGLYSNLDLSLVVPLIDIEFDGEPGAQLLESVFDNRYPDDPLVQNRFVISEPISISGGGIGDILVRAKYGLLQERTGHAVSLALGYDLKTPTGDEDKLLGTGEVDHRFRILIGKQLYEGGFYPTLELGYLLSGSKDAGGDSFDAFEYRLSTPFLAKAWRDWETDELRGALTLSPEIVGRVSDVADRLDAGLSARLALGENLLLQAGVRFAIDDDEGLVAPWVPTVGVEYRF